MNYNRIIPFGAILLGCFLGLLLFCSRKDQPVMIKVAKTYLDSLEAAARIVNLPPDTIKEIKYLKGKTVYLEKKVPVPVPVLIGDTAVKTYSDSIDNNEISARVDLKIKGTLEDIAWKYKPTYQEVTKTIYERVPVPHDVIKKEPQTGIYGIVGAGKGPENMIFSGSLSYLNAKGRIVGIEVGNYVNTYIKINYGFKF
jgi:hypothetical protein